MFNVQAAQDEWSKGRAAEDEDSGDQGEGAGGERVSGGECGGMKRLVDESAIFIYF
jgi:hypothetical protein